MTCTSASATPRTRPAPTSPSLKTRAVRDGDEYIVNGQKMWTSLASEADYCWLAVRTDPDAAEAQGHLDDHRRHEDPWHHGRSAPPPVEPRHQRRSTSRTSGSRPSGWSVARTRVGSSSRTSSTTSASRCARRACWSRASMRSGRLGAEHHRCRRRARGRPRVGAVEPGQGPRRARLPQAHQLEGGVDGNAGSPGRRRRLHHQDVRHRVLPGVVPTPDGDPRTAGVPGPWVGRIAPPRSAGDELPQPC